MTTRRIYSSPHTFWTTPPGVDRPGRAAGIPRLDVNIMTDSDAEDHETEPAAAASVPPSSPVVTTVKVGRVYDRTTDQDGNRVLVDRLWPRGISKSKADIDEWCKQVAPSTALRKWYSHDPQRFAEFRRRYQTELASGEHTTALAHLRELATDRALTLLTASKDPLISEAAVLAELLQRPSPATPVLASPKAGATAQTRPEPEEVLPWTLDRDIV